MIHTNLPRICESKTSFYPNAFYNKRLQTLFSKTNSTDPRQRVPLRKLIMTILTFEKDSASLGSKRQAINYLLLIIVYIIT